MRISVGQRVRFRKRRLALSPYLFLAGNAFLRGRS